VVGLAWIALRNVKAVPFHARTPESALCDPTRNWMVLWTLMSVRWASAWLHVGGQVGVIRCRLLVRADVRNRCAPATWKDLAVEQGCPGAGVGWRGSTNRKAHKKIEAGAPSCDNCVSSQRLSRGVLSACHERLFQVDDGPAIDEQVTVRHRARGRQGYTSSEPLAPGRFILKRAGASPPALFSCMNLFVIDKSRPQWR